MKVLICEDNAELRQYIAGLLQDLAVLQTTANGSEALSIVRSWAPDLVLSDVMMPGIDGVELCSAIKSDPATTATVVVLLTAQTQRDAMLKGWDAKADEYLFKPFHPEELRTRIRSLLAMIIERRNHTDVIERKNKELLIAQTEMKQKRKLEAYAKALESSNKELEEFAFICAHDMKSPVASLRGLVDMMDQKNAVKPLHERLFSMVKKSVHQMQKTVSALNETLAYKKTFNHDRDEVQFRQALQDVKNVLSIPIQSTGASIEADFSECPSVYFSRLHLESILQNLVANSIKYARDSEPPVIHIKTSHDGEYVVLEIKDNGIGIDLDLYKDKLFHLFQRFHTHTEGSGIGLYIVRSIVEYYEGKIMIDSAVDKGTTFKIYLTNAHVPKNTAC